MGQSYSEEFFDQRTSPKIKSFQLMALSSSTLRAMWQWHQPTNIHKQVQRIMVFYQHADEINIFKQHFDVKNNVTLSNLKANTRYQVCVAVYGKMNETRLTREEHCLNVSTTFWHPSAAIGASVGVLLAFLFITLMLLLSQRAHRRRRNLKRGNNTMISKHARFNSTSTFGPQFDSLVIHDESCVLINNDKKTVSFQKTIGENASSCVQNDVKKTRHISEETNFITNHNLSPSAAHLQISALTSNIVSKKIFTDELAKANEIDKNAHGGWIKSLKKHVVFLNDMDKYTVDLMKYKYAPVTFILPNESPSPSPPPTPPLPLPSSSSSALSLDLQREENKAELAIASFDSIKIYTQLIETL